MKNKEDILILSIESSGALCGVALSRGSELLAEYSTFISNQHDRLLAVYTDRILKDFSLDINNLDAIAISSGPGSFTGLRIGASLAKGLCFGGKPNMIAIPCTQSLATALVSISKLSKKSNIFIAIASHRDNVYTQCFDLSAKPLTAIQLRKIEDIEKIEYQNSFVAGSGTCLLQDSGYYREYGNILPGYLNSIALQSFLEQKFVDPSEFSPDYHQDFTPKGKSK